MRDDGKVAGSPETLLLQSAELLFTDGQTTERMVDALARLGAALGFRTTTVLPRWGELMIHVDGAAGTRQLISAARPAGIHMGKVAATMIAIDASCAGQIDAPALASRLAAISKYPPASLFRFTLASTAGALALAVIFGAAHLLSYLLIALSAGAGAVLRRWLAKLSENLYVQPFCAALLAGVIGAIAIQFQLSTAARLIAVCPCMILVPGPHLLNGMLDLARGRVALGAARMIYASVIILMICTGLLLGLALGGESLPVTGPSQPVALVYDVLAAGVAVSAYGTFFSMSWRTLPVPILMGMFAHATRWVMLSVAGASVEAGAFVACLIVGTLATPIAARLRFPFAALAFASVVSLIPGVALFRMAGGLVALMTRGADVPLSLLTGTITDGMTAVVTLVAMAFGLIMPKLFISCFLPNFTR